MSDLPTFKSTGFQHLDAKLAKQLEAMRERAEAAEARIAEVSGVTREQLAKREYERGLADGAKAVKS